MTTFPQPEETAIVTHGEAREALAESIGGTTVLAGRALHVSRTLEKYIKQQAAIGRPASVKGEDPPIVARIRKHHGQPEHVKSVFRYTLETEDVAQLVGVFDRAASEPTEQTRGDQAVCGSGHAGMGCGERLHFELLPGETVDGGSSVAIRCLSCGTVLCTRCAPKHFQNEERRQTDTALRQAGEMADLATKAEEERDALRAKLAEAESATCVSCKRPVEWNPLSSDLKLAGIRCLECKRLYCQACARVHFAGELSETKAKLLTAETEAREAKERVGGLASANRALSKTNSTLIDKLATAESDAASAKAESRDLRAAVAALHAIAAYGQCHESHATLGDIEACTIAGEERRASELLGAEECIDKLRGQLDACEAELVAHKTASENLLDAKHAKLVEVADKLRVERDKATRARVLVNRWMGWSGSVQDLAPDGLYAESLALLEQSSASSEPAKGEQAGEKTDPSKALLSDIALKCRHVLDGWIRARGAYAAGPWSHDVKAALDQATLALDLCADLYFDRLLEAAERDVARELRERIERPAQTYGADEFRERGWSVAVHNDYRQHGAPMTFWLFTKGDLAAKGEGMTDAIALAGVLCEIERLDGAGKKPTPELMAKRDAGRKETRMRTTEDRVSGGMSIARALELAKGAAPTPAEARELADEVLRLRDALQGCRLAAERICREVSSARPESNLGSWR